MRLKTGLKVTGVLIALAGAGYATTAAMTWLCFGRKRRHEEEKSILDDFLAQYQIIERYRVDVDAPAETAFAAAARLSLEDSGFIRAIFRTRERLMGSKPISSEIHRGLVEQAILWGWGVLYEAPGKEILFGAVTQPWIARPLLQALRPEEFAEFSEPGFVKIAWSLKVYAVDEKRSVLSTETRATTTDDMSRVRFRRYWSLVMPGTVVIRKVALCQARRQAESMVAGHAKEFS